MASKYPNPFGNFARLYREYRRKLPQKISLKATDEIKHNFIIGGYRREAGVVFWEPRKSKKSISLALLIKSGRLSRSIRPSPTFHYARVITDVPYASALNNGYQGNVNVKAHQRKHFSRAKGVFSIKTKKAVKHKIKNYKNTGQVKAHKRKVDMKPRPFMEVGTPFFNVLERDIYKDLDNLFMKA